MNKIYVLGSINMDMVITTPYIPEEGETLTGSNFFLNGGGKGANQAVAAAKQNIPTYLIGNVGNDVFGSDLINTLLNYNVETSFINKISDTSTGVAMIIIHNNDNRIILDGGANHKISLTQIDEALENTGDKDIFITQLENNLDAVIYGLKKAKEHNMITVFNPAPAKKLPGTIYETIDYLILNETECEILTGLYPNDENDIKKIFHQLNVKNLIITLGSKGSLLVKNNEIIQISPNKVTAIDSTAAGDTYVGVFASQLVKGKTEIEALNYASVAASLTCLKEGAQQSIPYEQEVDDYLANKNSK